MNGKAQICDQCGAPMTTRRQCDYCGTIYYLGPEIPENNWANVSPYVTYGSSFTRIWVTAVQASNQTVFMDRGPHGRASGY